MTQELNLDLPILGMTCASCVQTVERSLKKAGGVFDATVNFATERATVHYNPEQFNLDEAIDRVTQAGYSVAQATVELPLLGMTCSSCANTIEHRLNQVDGVTTAVVNFATEKAAVTYIPEVVTRPDLVSAVRQTGYDVVETVVDDTTEDAETAAREAEINHQMTRSSLA